MFFPLTSLLVFQFTPQLPSYLVFSQSSGRLITTSDASPMEATVFTVSCESGAGSAEVTIEVQTCSGDNTYTSTMNSSSATVVLKRQSVLRKFVLTSDIRSVCFPPDTFEMTMTCSRPPCVVGFATSDNLLLLHKTISNYQPVTVTFDPHTSDSVVLREVPDSYYLVPNKSFTFSVPIEGPFFPVTFNPPLPQGVSWNPYSQLFVAQLSRGVYTIAMTVSNRKGSVTKELTLNVGTCRTDYEQMGLHARSRSYDSLTIRSDANKLVFSESLTVATSDFTLCLPRGEYWVNVTRTMKSYLEEDYDVNFTDNDGDIIEARSDDAVHGGGDYVVKKMKESMKEIQEGAQMHFMRASEVAISPSPQYRYPFPWRAVIFAIVSVAGLVLYSYLLIFCYRQSLRSKMAGLPPTVKQLKKGRMEQESLLLRVRCINNGIP